MTDTDLIRTLRDALKLAFETTYSDKLARDWKVVIAAADARLANTK